MDINAINDAIQTLESSDTTFDNVQELASLYIVREHLETRLNQVVDGSNDVLPGYKGYCIVKRRYQLGEVTEDTIVPALKIACNEIKGLVDIMYSGTEFHKERRQICDMVQCLYDCYVKE